MKRDGNSPEEMIKCNFLRLRIMRNRVFPIAVIAPTVTCSKLTIEAVEQDIKYVQS